MLQLWAPAQSIRPTPRLCYLGSPWSAHGESVSWGGRVQSDISAESVPIMYGRGSRQRLECLGHGRPHHQFASLLWTAEAGGGTRCSSAQPTQQWANMDRQS